MSDPLEPLRAYFAELRLQRDGTQAQVYAGRDADGDDMTVVVLTEAVSADPRLRHVFAEIVWRHSVGSEPGRATVYSADLHALRPWAAVRTESGQPGAEQLFDELVAPPPAPAGPAPGDPGTPTPTPTGAATVVSGSAPRPVPAAPGPVPPPPGPVVAAGRPAGGRRVWPWVVAVVAVVAAVALAGVGVVYALPLLQDEDDPPVVGLPTPTATPAPVPGPTEPPEEGVPRLRPIDPVSLVGPTFAPNDATFTIAYQDFHFAFRVPLEPSWNCLGGTWDVDEDVPARVCAAGGNQQVQILYWECETTCTEEEQEEMVPQWMSEHEQAVHLPTSPTAYREQHPNERDRYELRVTHFGGEPGGDLQYMIGLYADSPWDLREDIQKIVNDIIGQSSP